MAGGFEHNCGRSEAAEAAVFNLALFGHLSGENRARMGWPFVDRLQALLLVGDIGTARLLTEQMLRGPRRTDAPLVQIPSQRKPHPQEMPLPSQPELVRKAREAHHPHLRTDIQNNRPGR